MGYNATVVVLCDRLDEIENDPEFGKKLARAIRAKNHEDVYITGQTQVIAVAHADTMQVVAVGGNTGRVIGWGHYSSSNEDLAEAVRSEAKKVTPSDKSR